MITPATGKILQSTGLLDDSVFEKTFIMIAEQNANGATGFVINKLFPRTLNELEEFKDCPAFPLYDGGPVDKIHLYFLHRRPDIIEGGTLICDHTYYGGNFQQAIIHIRNKSISAEEIKIFVGYCGWDAGELKDEIQEGSWNIMAAKGNAGFNEYIFLR